MNSILFNHLGEPLHILTINCEGGSPVPEGRISIAIQNGSLADDIIKIDLVLRYASNHNGNIIPYLYMVSPTSNIEKNIFGEIVLGDDRLIRDIEHGLRQIFDKCNQARY